jgi:hypothetical protein
MEAHAVERPAGLSRRAAVLALPLAIGLFVGLAPIADVLGWAFLAMSATAVAYLAWRTPAVRQPLLAAFFARAGAALVHAYVTALPDSSADAATFERYGWTWAQDGLAGALDYFTPSTYLYSWIIALFYAVTDRSPLMIQCLNVLFGTLVVWNTFAIGRLLWGEQAGRRAAWIVALFPTAILYSAITMREVAVVYPLTLGVLWFLKWRATNRPLWIIGSMAMFTLSVAFHRLAVSMMALAMGYVALRWLSALRRGRVVAAVQLLFGGAVLVALAAVVLGGGWGEFSYSYITLEAVQVQQDYAARDRTAYLEGMVTDSLSDLLWQPPIRMVFFLFMPFPWMVRMAQDLLGLLDALLYLWLFWNVARAWGPIRRSRERRSALLLALTGIFTMALVVSNYGTAIRHRAKMVPVIAAVAAGGMVMQRRRVPVAEEVRAARLVPAGGT